MIEALRTRDRLHGHVRAQRHALVDVASRGKRIRALLLWVATAVRGSGGAIVDTVLAHLLHRRQLEFLVVEVVGFFTSVALALTRKLFIQVDALWTLS